MIRENISSTDKINGQSKSKNPIVSVSAGVCRTRYMLSKVKRIHKTNNIFSQIVRAISYMNIEISNNI